MGFPDADWGELLRRGGAAAAAAASHGNASACHGAAHGGGHAAWDSYDHYVVAECQVLGALTMTAILFEWMHEWLHHQVAGISYGGHCNLSSTTCADGQGGLQVSG